MGSKIAGDRMHEREQEGGKEGERGKRDREIESIVFIQDRSIFGNRKKWKNKPSV